MSNIPSELRYVTTHEWVRDEGNGIFTVGITEHAQELLGDMVFVELPEVGAVFGAGDEIGVVESVKAASDVYSPITGTVTAVNSDLEDSPELVNTDAFGEGWLFQIEAEDPSEVEGLLDAEGYQNSIDED